ncbi:MAG: TlpA family protein disulfide reductase [Nitrospirae bacterium]|nr:TlpA family protein disulfide reductase [Nitrospirota bacterium]
MIKRKLIALMAAAVLSLPFVITPYIYAQNFLPFELEKIIGEKAPDFTLKDMSGKSVTLSSFKGKLVVLNFWATWCPYCRQERPHLKSLYETYKGKDLVIIAVSTDRSEKPLKKFMEYNPAPYIVLSDTEGFAAVPYNVMSLPTTFLIDREGKISRKFMGMVEWEDRDAKGLIDKLLNQ